MSYFFYLSLYTSYIHLFLCLLAKLASIPLILAFARLMLHEKINHQNLFYVYVLQGVGTGNDFYGWEFYKDVKAAWGSIITPEMKWENPAPSHMYWSPDKMRVEYILESPYLPQVLFKSYDLILFSFPQLF